MPAPPADLVTALRKGLVTRRVFFEMTHSGGTVRVCDGIGDYRLDGVLYRSIAGLAAVDGVSDSGDIQNHNVVAKLNGAAVAQLSQIDPDIRGETATIRLAWITEEGNVLTSRTVAILRGSHLVSRKEEYDYSIAAHLRGPTALWQAPPRAYYTDKDQQRRYPGDTGMSFVKTLENANANGWSVDEETTGGVPTWYGGAIIHTAIGPRDSLSLAPIGDHTRGLNLRVLTSAIKRVADSVAYLEDVTGAPVSCTLSGPTAPFKVGGTDCYVDIFGDLRSPGGERLILSGGSASDRLRVQTEIVADGTPGATTIQKQSDGANPTVKVIHKTGTAVTNGANTIITDQIGRVYCNKNGGDIASVSNVPTSQADSTPYVEATTGTAATFQAATGGKLQVGGVDCVLSSTGVVLSAGGRRIVKQGGTPDEFLRVWT